MKPAMFKNEQLDFFAPADGASIPQEDQRAPDVEEHLPKEVPSIQSCEAAAPKPDVQSDVLSLWRDRQSPHGGDMVPLVV